ncbi:MAG: hypothetical protein P9L99_15185 [Candidatus Lernaella stagnicola]|nr:hypothetical protein [Candidatus Lernaella stagnicola]
MSADPPIVKRPSRALTVLGAVVAALLGALLFVVGANEYLFPSWGRYVALGAGVAIGLTLRLVRRGAGHEFAWALLTLFLYNAHLSLGGYTYLGWVAPVLFILLAAIPYPLFRRRTCLWRILAGLNAAFFVGLVLLMVYRDFSFVDERAQCRAEADKAPSFVRELGGPTHPYDFAGNPKDAVAGVAYGYENEFYLIDRDQPTLRRGGTLDARIQRLTPHPQQREFFVPLWAQWGTDERMFVMDMDAGTKVREIAVPGCRNLFDVEFYGGRLYALCEVSHSLHEFDEAPPHQARRSLVLPGMDSYDMAIDATRGVAFVSDWFSPWLTVVDLASMTVREKKWIGFSSFEVKLGPDDNLYVAQMFLRRVLVLNAKTLARIDTIDAGYGPRDLEFDLDRGLLLIGNYFDGTIDYVRLADRKRIGRVFVGRPLRGLWYDADYDRLYAACGCGVKFAKTGDVFEGQVQR